MSFSNSIALAKQYTPILDAVYKRESLSSVLDNANGIRFKGGNKVEVYKLSMNGAGTYSRNNGYVDGDATGTWEELTLEQDRGRRFLLDAMDQEESLAFTVGNATSVFQKEKQVPELDAYRFAKYATGAGLSGTAADITSSTDVAALIDAAVADMNDEEVPDGKICFISNTAFKQLKNNVTRYVENGEDNIKKTILMYDGMRIIPVPQKRFNTQITLLDGTTAGQEAGGYSITAGGYKINFLIIHPSAVWQVLKHQTLDLIPAAYNNNADGDLLKYRFYHDCGVFANKTKGVYLHRAATANV